MIASRLQLAALLPDTNAELNLAYYYQVGIDGDKDISAAISIYQKLTDAGNEVATYNLGSLLLSDKKLEDALFYFEKASDLNNSSASYWAYSLYSGYENYPENKIKATYYLERASALGHLYAKRDLAFIELKKAGYLMPKIIAFILYLKIQFQTIFLLFTNRADLRVR
jgi:TPR repeat protein